jgi:TetR/AcrR family transcriptional repressor of nem operon
VTDRRTQILDAAARLMGERGYRQTSVEDVIAAAGLAGKAHFYHYFKSKQELGLAVLDRQFEHFTERGLAILREPMIDPIERLELFIDSLVALQVAQAAGGRGGSPFGALAEELAGNDEGFRARLVQAFGRWTAQLQSLLWEAGDRLVEGTDAGRLARFVVATLEGALMMARVTRDVGMLPGIAADLKRFVAMHLRQPTGGGGDPAATPGTVAAGGAEQDASPRVMRSGATRRTALGV